MTRRIVIGYDGSEEATRALVFAARVLTADSAVVANVWNDPGTSLVPAPIGAPPPVPSASRDAELERSARDRRRGRRAGAGGRPRGFSVTRVGAGTGDIARVLHDLAEEYDGELIVVGRRHASLIESALLGSVSSAAVRDERRPVLVVPS